MDSVRALVVRCLRRAPAGAKVESPLLAWLGTIGATDRRDGAEGTAATAAAPAVATSEGGDGLAPPAIVPASLPLLELVATCAAGHDAAVQASARWMMPIGPLAIEMQHALVAATPRDDGTAPASASSATTAWMILAQLLQHAHLQTDGGRSPLPRGGSGGGVPLLRAMWTCNVQLRAIADAATEIAQNGAEGGDGGDGGEGGHGGDGGGEAMATADVGGEFDSRATLRPALACIIAYVGGRAGGPQRLVVSRTTSQRALLAALHASLLALVQCHVAVGRAGRKMHALSGGGRRVLDVTIGLLEACSEVTAPRSPLDGQPRAYSLAARRPIEYDSEWGGVHSSLAADLTLEPLPALPASPHPASIRSRDRAPPHSAELAESSARTAHTAQTAQTAHTAHTAHTAAGDMLGSSGSRQRGARQAGGSRVPHRAALATSMSGGRDGIDFIMNSLRDVPVASFEALTRIVRVCVHDRHVPLMLLSLAVLRALLPTLPSAVFASADAASLVLDLLVSDTAAPDTREGPRGTERKATDAGGATDAAIAADAADAVATARLALERLRLCDAMLQAGGEGMRTAVEARLGQRPWLAGLCARTLVVRLRCGALAARSPHLQSTRRTTRLAAPAVASSEHARTAGAGAPAHVEAVIAELVGAFDADDDGDALCALAGQLGVHPCAMGEGVDAPAERAETGGIAADELGAIAAYEAAALPPALRLIEGLAACDSSLRAAAEWQLAGHRPAVQVRWRLGSVAARSHKAMARPSTWPSSASTRTPSLRWQLHLSMPELAVWAKRTIPLPHWSTVLCCAIILVLGGVLGL